MKSECYKVPYRIPLPNNMGMVRYVLAISVVIAHYSTLTGNSFYFPISSYAAVGGFFALSGFLIYGSYLRKPNLKTYLLSRARRLLPAYWITVIFFALILCFISSYSAQQYFSSSQFWRYLISNVAFLNFLQPSLPGVFEGFGIDAVNGSLWTMKVEWALYLTPPIVILLIRKCKVRPILIFIIIYILSSSYRILFSYLHEHTGLEIYNILGRQFLGQLSYFYAGVICYYLFEYIMHYKWTAIAIALGCIGICGYVPYGNYILHPIAVAVIAVWFSMVGKWGTWEGKRDNVSYNIYLLPFPVIQMFVYFRGGEVASPILGLLICICATILLAILLYQPEKIIRNWLNHSARLSKH